MAKDLAEKSGSALAAPIDYGDMQGQGWENTSQDDFSIPFLGLFQSGSPQLKKKDPKYDEAAAEGLMFDTVSGEVFPEDGIIFVPVVTDHCFVEWQPRDKGGGYVGRHETSSQVVQKAKQKAKDNKLFTDNGNQLVETFYMYGQRLTDPDDPGTPLVIGFNSTKIKKYKGIMSRMRTFQVDDGQGNRKTPPLFAFRLIVKATEEKNVHGTFQNFDIEPYGGEMASCLLDPKEHLPVLQASQSLAQSISTGEARAAHDSQNAGAGSAGDGDESAF